MQMTVSQRLARSMVGAAVATFVALGSHVLGGGALPSAAGLIVPLALSFAVCVQLSGKALSLWRLAIAVGASQFLFHTLFALGSSSLTVSDPTHAHHGVGALEVTGTSVHGAHGGAAMSLAHLGAAVITTAALFHAEWLLARGGQLLIWLSRPFRPGRSLSSPVLPRFGGVALATAATPSATFDLALSSVSHRGPPRTH